MTITSRVSLKAALSDGQTLTGDNLANLIDSYIHLTDTSAQSVASPVTFTASVQAANINCNDIDTSSVNFAHAAGGSIAVSSINITTNLSAAAANFAGTVSAIDIYASGVHAIGVKTNAVSAGLVQTGRVITSALSATRVVSSTMSVAIFSADTLHIDGASIFHGEFSATEVSATKLFTVSADIINLNALQPRLGNTIFLGGMTFQTVPTTGVAVTGPGSAVPASVAGYLEATVSGVDVRIPYFTKG